MRTSLYSLTTLTQVYHNETYHDKHTVTSSFSKVSHHYSKALVVFLLLIRLDITDSSAL